MDLYVELETLKLVTSVTDRREIRSINVKRGDALPLTVRFLKSQTATRLDATTVITLAFKESGKYDDNPVVLEQSFTASAVGSPDSDPYYTASPSLNTTELSALFSIDSNSSNDPASVTLMGELTWTATGDSGPTSIKTFSVVCENDVYRGDEGLLPSVPGNVPGTAASVTLTFDNAIGDAIDITAGSFTVGDWSVNLWDGSTGSAPAEPYIQYTNGATIIQTWIVMISEAINTGAVTAGGTLVGTLAAHNSATATGGVLGQPTIDWTLTADEVGTQGNSIAYAFATTPSEQDKSGNLAGGIDTRNFAQDDFVSTLPDTLTDAQKIQAIANLMQVGAFTVIGDLEAGDDGTTGLILHSPDGSRWRIKVDNTGTLSTTSL